MCSNDQDAEDLTFRTLDRAIKKIHQYDPKRNFFTWLYAILLNFRRMDLRRKRMPVIPMGGTETGEEVSGLMFLGFIRECIRRARTNRRKEED